MSKSKPQMVKFLPSVQANTAVRGPTSRYLVYTDPNDKDLNVSAPMLALDIARQLVKAGVGEIEGGDPDEHDDQDRDQEDEQAVKLERAAELLATGGETGAAAAERVAANVQADNAGGAGVSGADSRDTSAFATPPAQAGARVVAPSRARQAGSEERQDADAPPTGAEDSAPKAPAKKAPAKAPAKKPAPKATT